MKTLLFLLIAGCLWWQPAFSQPAGVLDPLFGTQGKSVVDAGVAFIQPAAMVVQDDGNTVVLGTLYSYEEPAYHDFILVRYRPDGSLDTTFGKRGRTVTDLKGRDYATSLSVQKDGRIVACGYSWDNGYYWSLARYDADGRPDSSFGVAGRTYLGFIGSTSSNLVLALPDGKLLVAGTVQYAPMQLWTYARFLPNGQPDPGFGVQGQFGDITGTLTAAVLQDSLHFLAAGTSGDRLVVMRHDIDGIPDPMFGDGGFVVIADTSQAATITVQPDQNILISGYFGEYQQERLLLARLYPDGTPDPGFGNTGVAWSRSPFRNGPHALSLRGDGRIVLAGIGDTVVANALWYDFRLAQFRADGYPDTTFGANQTAVLSRGGLYDDVTALSVRPDENILILGNENWNFSLTRHFPNGSLDPAFGQNGIIEAEIVSPQSDEQVDALAIDPDGRILIGGRSYHVLTYDALLHKPFLTRLLPNGEPDTAFATNGTLRTFLPGAMLAIQPDTKILAAGHHTLRRFLPDGSPDIAFGQYGLVFDYRLSETDVAVQPDGRIVLAGAAYAGIDAPSVFALARYLSDGAPDPAFGANGLASVSFGFSPYGEALAVDFQPDGKILACGYADTGSSVKFALARFLPDGTPDSAFGIDGRVTTGFADDAFAYRMALQPDGKILIGGQMAPNILVMARYLPDGSPDHSFGDAGRLSVANVRRANDLALDSAGRIMVAADYQQLNDYNFTVYRFQFNGSPDTSFGLNGRLTIDLGGNYESAGALSLVSGGKVLVAGHVDGDIVVVRLLGSPNVGVLDFSSPVQEVLVYPNPVRESSLLEFELRDAADLSVVVYDLTGRPVRTIAGQQYFPAGKHQVALLMGDLPAGGYVVLIQGENGKVAVRVVK